MSRPVLADGQALGQAYTVQAGNTLSLIGQRWGVSPDRIAMADRLADPNVPGVSEVLLHPAVEWATPSSRSSAPSRSVLERTPPELASDVVDRGIILTGGTSLLRNLDRLVTQEIGISCYVADNPLECVAMGAGIALDHLDLIKRSMPAEGEWLVSFRR